MGDFRHTPDDYIVFDTDVIPLAFFLTLEPAYALPVAPAGIINIEYSQSLSLYVGFASGTQYALAYPDTTIDGYITNKAAYVAAYAAYLNPPLTLSQQKVKLISEMVRYSKDIKGGYVTIGVNTYFSDIEFTRKILYEFEAYTRLGSLPGGYYINDINYAPVTPATGLVDLAALVDKIVELHYLVDLNADVHRAAINALTVIPDVLAYDYSGGWPTVPHV